MIGKTQFLAVLVILFGAGSAWADLTDGLVAHWKLDGDATDSAGSNDGTLVNGPTWTTGQIGGALSFDGIDDYVDMVSPGPLGNSPRTITAWAKTSSSATQIFFSYGGTSAQHGSTIRAGFSAFVCEGVTLDISYGVVTYSATVADGQWHHYAYVVPDKVNAAIGDVELYQDGVLLTDLCASIYSSIINTTPNYAVDIGRYTSDQTGYFNGIIDDVRIYNRALSAGEVRQLYGIELVGLEIVGPDEVAESSQVSYKAIAYFDNNSTADITDLAVWSVEPNDYAGIVAGLLTTKIIDLPEDITITAEYSEGEVTKEAQKDVSIFAICPSGSALEFDGEDDYVEIGDNLNNVNVPFSVATWVNINQPGAYGVFASDNATSGNYYGFWLGVGHNYIDVCYGDGTGRNPSDRRTKKSNISIPLNTWVFVVAVVRGPTDMDIYKNGINVGGEYTGSGGNMVHNTNKAVIGDFSVWQHNYFNGIIDDVRVYNRALSAEEIQELMHTRPEAGEPNLVAYWDFDEGEGQLAGDSAGSNDGQLGSTPDIDDSDPNWVDSDAPVGKCSLDGLVERNVFNVLDIKSDILDLLDIALGKEDALLDYMDDAFHNGQLDNLKKGDVVKAKQKIMGAIQQEVQAETAVDQSIEKLDDALTTLGIAPAGSPE